MKKANETISYENLEYIAKIYRKGAEKKDTAIYCINEDSSYYAVSLHHDVNDILHSMPDELSRIIFHDYLKPIDPNWWKSIYAPSTYYRMKNIALHTFFHCLYT